LSVDLFAKLLNRFCRRAEKGDVPESFAWTRRRRSWFDGFHRAHCSVSIQIDLKTFIGGAIV
jgi:N-acetylglutamate synthase-like GNAT family acetyltransferase